MCTVVVFKLVECVNLIVGALACPVVLFSFGVFFRRPSLDVAQFHLREQLYSRLYSSKLRFKANFEAAL